MRCLLNLVNVLLLVVVKAVYLLELVDLLLLDVAAGA